MSIRISNQVIAWAQKALESNHVDTFTKDGCIKIPELPGFVFCKEISEVHALLGSFKLNGETYYLHQTIS